MRWPSGSKKLKMREPSIPVTISRLRIDSSGSRVSRSAVAASTSSISIEKCAWGGFG